MRAHINNVILTWLSAKSLFPTVTGTGIGLQHNSTHNIRPALPAMQRPPRKVLGRVSGVTGAQRLKILGPRGHGQDTKSICSCLEACEAYSPGRLYKAEQIGLEPKRPSKPSSMTKRVSVVPSNQNPSVCSSQLPSGYLRSDGKCLLMALQIILLKVAVMPTAESESCREGH